MRERGLCSTCVNDKNCTFPRKFPIWQCDEFQDYEPKSPKAKQEKHKKI